MKIRFALFALSAILGSAVGTSPQLASAQAPGAAYAPSASELRLWQLIERDRPRNLLEGNSYDPKDGRRMDREFKRQAALMITAAADYRRIRSVAARRRLIEIVNRGGMHWDDSTSGGTLRQAFLALHEAGPPLNDPDNGNDPVFAAKRHRALLRLLAYNLWRYNQLGEEQRRLLAGYMSDCERRPSLERPSGNNHDPSCGFIFELKYPGGTSGWDEARVPQSMADYAAGIPSARPRPEMDGYSQYPLVPKGPVPGANEIWAGNRTKFAWMYALPYFAGREYNERRSAEAAIAQAVERKRANELAAYRRGLVPQWDALWQRTNLTPDEQLQLESLSETLYRFDIYRTRYNIISYDRLAKYCQLGFAYECSRMNAIDNAAREQRRAAQGNWGSAPANQSVTVRSYDRNGNYTGSTTTTRIDAELMGAR